MKTEFELLVESATAKGLSVYHNTDEFDRPIVGVQTKSYMVYWYNILDRPSRNGYLLFNHVYNCNSGKTLKGLRMGYNFLHKMIHKNA